MDIASYLVTALLDKLGVQTPEQKDIVLIESLLSHTVIRRPLSFNVGLSQKETTCLLLAAQGNTAKQTASIVDISPESVTTCRRSIKRKLKVASMAQAVFEGMRFGYIQDYPSPQSCNK